MLIAFRSYLVVDTNGKILYQGKRVGGKANIIGGASGAVRSNRIAFLFGHIGRDLEDTVIVLDVDAKKEVARLEVHQPAEIRTFGPFVEQKFTRPSLALSPDGKKLAVVTGSMLSLYDIP